MTDVPRLVAHRGYLHRYPENTWIALQAALEAGACWLEFDVQRCADGHFVLLHDADFERTAGRKLSVFDVDAATLAGLSVHEPARLGGRFAPLRPSLLQEVLQRLDDYPAARVMVEIKIESLQHWGLEPVIDGLLQLLEPHLDRCTLISFSEAALAQARKASPIDIGWVLPRYDREHLQRARRLRPQWLICNHRRIPPQSAPERGDWRWMLYQIDDPQQALYWAGRGVELVETGDIGTLLQHPLLATRACRHRR